MSSLPEYYPGSSALSSMGVAVSELRVHSPHGINVNEHGTANTLTTGQQTTLEDVFPTLQDMHANRHVATAQFPDGHPQFAGADVEIMPFYMNSYDPNSLGVWGVAIRGHLTSRLHAEPTPTGSHYYALTIRSVNPERPTSLADVAVVVGLIGALAAVQDVQPRERWISRAAHAVGALLSRERVISTPQRQA